jgi:hypothetical protein
VWATSEFQWSRWHASDMDGQTREGEVFRAETESIGATWTGSPQGVFAERNHHKPRLALKNITAGVREREDEIALG